MTGCEFKDECSRLFVGLSIESRMRAFYEKYYCSGGKTVCARYIVFIALGKNKVPNNLYPIMLDQAKVMIGAQNPRSNTIET